MSFGDSLSGVGTSAVGSLAARGGGNYTVNGAGSRIRVELLALLAAQLGLGAVCPAQIRPQGGVVRLRG